jgi:tRNA threonylcarbamoyladenosine biosynthesis protein TsaB
LKILSLSTAEQGCSLAVFDGESLVYEEYWTSRITHSKRLLGSIQSLFENKINFGLKDVNLFVCTRGPGSFTGLRIGISMIKGFGFAFGKPTLGVSSLDGIAYRFSNVPQPVCIMMDAKRHEVYSATYRFKDGTLEKKSEEVVADPEKIVNRSAPNTLFAGSGSKAYGSVIKENASDPIISSGYEDGVNAVALVKALVGADNYLENAAHLLVPSYIRRSDAEMQLGKK